MSRFTGQGANAAELGGAKGRVSTCAIVLSEPPDSDVRWNLTVTATTRERGMVTLGRFLSVPPAAFAGLPGAPKVRAATRVVAIGSCAGAVSWKATGSASYSLSGAPTKRSYVDVTLTPTAEPVGLPEGLLVVNADGIGGPEVVEETAARVALAAGVPQLLVPYDEDRARVVVVPATGTVLVGPTPSANLTDFLLVPTSGFETRSRRPLYGFSAGIAAVTVYVERF